MQKQLERALPHLEGDFAVGIVVARRLWWADALVWVLVTG